MAAAAGLASLGAGTLVLPAAQQPQEAPPGPSTGGGGPVSHAPAISDSVTLRLVPRRKKKSVKWAEDVAEFDENAGKKKSKKCCIFHRRRQFGDWSDDDDSDAECDCGPQQGEQGGQPSQQPPQHAQLA